MLACCECCVRWRSQRRADHSSSGVLQTVVRRCVRSGNLKNDGSTTGGKIAVNHTNVV